MRIGGVTVLFLLLLCGGSHAAPMLFVSVSGENRIDSYAIDATTGALTRTAQTSLDGTPGALTNDPARKQLFVAYRLEGRLLNFEIDPKSGKLTEVSRTAAKIDPAHLSLDVSGQWLMAAYYPSGEVSVHKLDRDRRLPILGTWYATASNAHAVVPHRANAFVFVPHTSSNRIYQFRFNAGTGVLTPNTPPYFLTPDQTGPRHLVFHTFMERCYVSNEQGGSVSHYRFDPKTGQLIFVELIATLPDGYTGPNATSEIRMRPGGKHLYVANRGHDSIAGFAIDPSNGRLTPVGRFATESNPRSFDIDPSGKFLYVAGENSGRISAYRIDDATGELRRFAEYDAGQRPWWVLSVNVP
ncbi:6-phosphogluconolactonase [Caulifigura coniformis]|uniref:6-phosphogluconolactonase n=1 Tax=Caulifigura coniformis TaxID=2527983 RepID=A0A517SHM0_9PLAN|nr:lactonase family protein [Caulifigura coniformis]QDT55630.1 6-phosphogluconolactonase [Caulifigura coniformis]